VTNRPNNSAAPVICYRGVTFAYPAAAGEASGGLALQNVTFDVRDGERLGVLGPNGGGKSTLLKITLGLLTPQSGEVLIGGLSPREACKKSMIGYVPQRVEAELRFPVSVLDAVAMPLRLGIPPWRGLGEPGRREVARSLELVGAAGLSERPIGQLSGGQIQRVMIARALVTRPKVLLLDEPTVGIDAAGQQMFAELMTRLSTELGLTIVIVSHDLRTIASGCERVACLSRTLHFHDAPQGLTPQVLGELFRHDVAAIFGGSDRAWHVDAHPAAACCDHDHGTGTPTGKVSLSIEGRKA
jgi:zinc transport system ATP-binding protein